MSELKTSAGVKARKTYLDILRIIAMCMVYYAHTEIYGNTHYTVAGSAPSYYFGVFTTVFSAAGPTIFFFLSGALLLNREYEPGKKFYLRVLKFAAVCVIAEAFQIAMLLLFHPEYRANPVSGILRSAYSEAVILQYWFLFAYLAFLLMLPLLQSMVQHMSNKKFQYFFVLYIVLDGVLFLAEYFLRTDRFLVVIPLFTMSVFAPMLGYYLENRVKKEAFCTRNLIITDAVFVLTMVLAVIGYTKVELEIPIVSMVICVFLYWNLKMLCGRAKGNTVFAKILAFCSMGSLVVYLIDPQMHDLFRFIPEKLSGVLPWFIVALLWIFPALAVAVLIAGILRLIPGVNKLFK